MEHISFFIRKWVQDTAQIANRSSLHCPSCVPSIEGALSRLSIDPASISVSVTQQSVNLVTPPHVSRSQIYTTLYDAGFEVESEPGINLVSASGSSWLTIAIESRKRKRQHLRTCDACKSKNGAKYLRSLLSPSTRSRIESSCEPFVEELPSISSIPLQSNSYRVSLSIGGMTCAACVSAIMDALKDKPGVSEMNVDLLGKSGSAVVTRRDIGGEIKETIEIIGYECELVTVEPILDKSSKSVDTYRAILSIGGMTCASCESAISRGLFSSLNFVQSVDINLLGHSGTVTFTGRENVAKIKLTVEELGYDCDIASLFKLGSQMTPPSTRTILLEVDGMFCG